MALVDGLTLVAVMPAPRAPENLSAPGLLPQGPSGSHEPRAQRRQKDDVTGLRTDFSTYLDTPREPPMTQDAPDQPRGIGGSPAIDTPPAPATAESAGDEPADAESAGPVQPADQTGTQPTGAAVPATAAATPDTPALVPELPGAGSASAGSTVVNLPVNPDPVQEAASLELPRAADAVDGTVSTTEALESAAGDGPVAQQAGPAVAQAPPPAEPPGYAYLQLGPPAPQARATQPPPEPAAAKPAEPAPMPAPGSMPTNAATAAAIAASAAAATAPMPVVPNPEAPTGAREETAPEVTTGEPTPEGNDALGSATRELTQALKGPAASQGTAAGDQSEPGLLPEKTEPHGHEASATSEVHDTRLAAAQDSPVQSGVLAQGPARSQPVAQQLVEQILSRGELTSQPGRTEFRVRLDPPELGTVRVHLTATEHSVTARLIVSNESTRQLIQEQMHVLRQSLADAGVTLGRFDVASDGQQGMGRWTEQSELALPYVALPASAAPAASGLYQATRAPAGGVDLVV